MAFNKAKAVQDAAKLLGEGKVSQAIQMYRKILEKDPSDLTLLNTIGDLYLREKKVSDALASYHQLADAYCKEGFTVKAIAIYKKIIKIELNTAEPLLKLAELYMLQGLAREARDHYGQAVEFFRKRNQNDKALDVYRKILSLDPENVNYRMKFAEFCEQTGKKSDAAHAYTDLAELTLKRGDVTGAETALKKAAQLESAAPYVQLLRARVALAKRNLAEAEKIIEGSPALRDLPEGAQLLLEAYLADRKLDEAEKLVEKVWRAHPGKFGPVASFAALAADHGEYDAAFRALNLAAETLLERRETSELSESLKLLWAKAQHHIPTLELLYRVSEAASDANTIPDVLEALGHAYVQAGRLEDAEIAYQRLVAREPANEHYKSLLKQTQARAGKEPTLTGAAKALEEVELAPVVEAVPEAAGAAEEEAAAVREALENSDLFSRYGVIDKAVAELEKTLAVYPNQVEIHRRILEICHRSQPERAQKAAEQLARIFRERGETEEAQRYESLQRKLASGAGLEEFVAPVAPLPGAEPPAAQEFDLSAQFPATAEEPAAEAAAGGPPPEMPIPGFSEPVAPAPARVEEVQELDFSSDFEAFAGGGGAPTAAPPKEVFNYEESRIEIDFYLEQGLMEEARAAVEALEQRFPGHAQVAELRERMETYAALAGGGSEVVEAPPEPEPVTSTPEPEAQAGWDLPETFAPAPPDEEPAAPPAPEWAEPAPPPPATTPEPEPVMAEAGGTDLLGDLASDLAGSLEGIQAPEAPPPARQPVPSGGTAAPAGGEGLFSDLLDELGGGAEAEAQAEDPETHYNLGVAFREMGLLDEAIGEFQKVVKGVKGGMHPPNFLQACTLLAACFMDKELPAIAAKWYARALEAPDLNEESVLALQYDLGVAYEKAGDVRTALAKFSEVYAHNIDYRDVAEKIRQLQKGA